MKGDPTWIVDGYGNSRYTYTCPMDDVAVDSFIPEDEAMLES